jgi:hypothetical protein
MGDAQWATQPSEEDFTVDEVFGLPMSGKSHAVLNLYGYTYGLILFVVHVVITISAMRQLP